MLFTFLTYFISFVNSASNEIVTSILISKSSFGGGLAETAVDCVVETIGFNVVDLVVDFVVDLVVDCVVDSVVEVVVFSGSDGEFGFITMSPSILVVVGLGSVFEASVSVICSVEGSLVDSDEDFVVVSFVFG